MELDEPWDNPSDGLLRVSDGPVAGEVCISGPSSIMTGAGVDCASNKSMPDCEFHGVLLSSSAGGVSGRAEGYSVWKEGGEFPGEEVLDECDERAVNGLGPRDTVVDRRRRE